MPSRRKLIEQVVEKDALYSEAMSAGSTSAHLSAAIDRKGYLSGFFVVQQKSATGANTATFTNVHIYEADASTGTFSIKNSATNTLSMLVTSASTTVDAMTVDLVGFKRYVKIYATPSGALTNTCTLSIAAVLGDRTSVDEPAT